VPAASGTSRPGAAWASLTGTERSVADLVAQGMTNRQIASHMFVSSHTVAFHLRQAFRKLGIGSRVELARLVFELGRGRPGAGPGGGSGGGRAGGRGGGSGRRPG
jgi:DNA-binding CsgD family transcriptional regulator